MSEKVNHKDFPNTAKGLQLHYGITGPTWQKWLRPIKDKLRKNAKIYLPCEMKIIIEFLEGQ